MVLLLTMPHVFVIIIIINVLIVLSHISYATDTITKSASFPDGSTLVSKDGTFEMGFFRPGKSLNRYVGIWYKNIPVRRVVWVANRNNPTKDDSSKLIISQDGNLVLLNHNDSLVWSTNASRNSSSPAVQLLNNGNLVLRDEKDKNEESFLWQGFDHPCDTLLAGMKSGWNRKLGLVWNMTAWRNEEDPSSGDVIQIMVLTSNPESVILKGSTKIHRTGPWNAPSSGVVGLKPNPLYDFVFVNNEDEVYYRYTLKNSSVISIVIVNQTLAIRQRLLYVPESKTWSVYQTTPLDACDYYNVCGANAQCIIDGSPMCQCLLGFKPKSPEQWNSMDWTQGCVLSGNWSCGIKNQDGFQKFVGMKFPNTTNSWINRNMTLNDCKIKCLQNCSCTAYTYLDANGAVSGCSIWFGDLIDLRILQSSGQDLYVRMDIDSSNFGGLAHGHGKKVVMVVSITVSMLLVMLLVFSYVYIFKSKLEGKKEKNGAGHEDFELPFFDLATMIKATNNFSINNKLGEGGFGPVYKGTLFDGQEIAVKRLSGNSCQGLKEFKNEVILCAKLQHRNLVKVIGCCIEGEERLLLYEYMSNKSLDLFLFDPTQSKLLSWSLRFNILNAIARGIQYLHQDSRLRIIHRDLKASNILLDNEMDPKISDFGMARMCGGDLIEGKTSRIVGTYGYMAPEYVIHGLFSVKSDVFSFGVLLLEIISGKKNRALIYHERDHNLIWHAWRLWNEGTPHNLIDECLRDACLLHEALRCIQIGLLCVQHDANDRPNMKYVITMLDSESTLPEPKEPGFLIQRILIEGQSSSKSQTSSDNGITITQLSAR